MTGRAAPAAHLAVRVVVRSDQEDLASGLIWEAGPAGLEIQAEVVAGELPIVAYFPARPGLVAELRERLRELAPRLVEEIAVPEVDWAARFRESFRGFAVGPFEVRPVWELAVGPLAPGVDPGARASGAHVGAHVLVVDPGRAFGTGTHETTRLCLRAIDRLAQSAPLGRVLDVGTGTGLLAIAALRRGASGAVALDNDPEAIAAAREHARLNAAPLQLLCADGVAALRSARFDLVLANLMAPLLLALRDELARVRAPGARLLLSGLLVSDVGEIAQAFAPLGRVELETDGEWAAALVLPS